MFQRRVTVKESLIWILVVFTFYFSYQISILKSEAEDNRGEQTLLTEDEIRKRLAYKPPPLSARPLKYEQTLQPTQPEGLSQKDAYIFTAHGVVENITVMDAALERLQHLKGLKGNSLRDYTYNSINIARDSMMAIMLPPDNSGDPGGCAQVNTTDDNLEIYLNTCANRNFVQDMCAVVEKYWKKDPKWKSLSSAQTPARTFLEVGALNGAAPTSNTRIFEKYMANLWQGLTVEATPANFAELDTNRPCTYRTEVALSGDWGWVDFIGWGGCCSGHEQTMSDSFKKHFHGKSAKSYKVLSAPIAEVAKAVPAMKKDGIDFLSLDVEGAEYFVLNGMNLSEMPVKMILIEAVQWPKTNMGDVNEKLKSLGYLKDTTFKAKDDMNELWIHKKHAEQWMMDIFFEGN